MKQCWIVYPWCQVVEIGLNDEKITMFMQLGGVFCKFSKMLLQLTTEMVLNGHYGLAASAGLAI